MNGDHLRWRMNIKMIRFFSAAFHSHLQSNFNKVYQFIRDYRVETEFYYSSFSTQNHRDGGHKMRITRHLNN